MDNPFDPPGESSRPREPQNGNFTEAETIRRAREGDAEAFERIYRRYSQRVYALCLKMVKDTADAEDLTQEAFLQVFRKINTFRGESAFSTWLHRLSVNIVLMRLRKRRLKEIPLEEFGDREEDSGALRQEIGSTDPLLDGLVDRVNPKRALHQMPPSYKRIFVLHDFLGYEHNEIAALLDCSLGNSKSQLHKARARMRGLL